jgi:hypothetical protein
MFARRGEHESASGSGLSLGLTPPVSFGEGKTVTRLYVRSHGLQIDKRPQVEAGKTEIDSCSRGFMAFGY